MTIGDAIMLIIDKYHDNKMKQWVIDPVAYTLYEVWKIVESKGCVNLVQTEEGET